MHGTRQRSVKRTANTNSTPSRRAPPPKRSKKSNKDTRSKSPEENTEPKYRVRHSPPSSEEEFLQITESTGDIFDAPANTLIIHACNCDGSWGAGIAAVFKKNYPQAFEVHKDHCDEYGTELIESAQLIPPVDYFEAGDENEETPDSALQFNIPSKSKTKAKHFVGCLFTSRHYGRRKDSPKQILAATAPAMVDLLRKVNAWNAGTEEREKIQEVRICKINSGLFAVPWAKTKGVLSEIDVGRSLVKEVRVVSPPER
jgi:ADP-ribose 1''-phosphate phosphatase